MRHGNRSSRLGVKTQHRFAMLRNLTKGLVEHGRIQTTVARAKMLRPFVEKLVTKLKDPSVPNLRYGVAKLANRDVVLSIAREVSPAFKDRNGGYIRILKLARRRAGDCADMALVEWVDESLVKGSEEPAAKPAKKKAAPKAKKAAKAEKTEEAVKPAKKKAAKKD